MVLNAKYTDNQKIIGVSQVEPGETVPLYHYLTDNLNVPENPSTGWSQIWNRSPPRHISNSFFSLLTVLVETPVSLATFR